MAWVTAKYKIRGVVPLLIHNGEMANPMSEGSRALKQVTGKKKKTDNDFAEMARIEWFYGLHLKDGKPIITPEMIEATLTNAAKLIKGGKDAARGITCGDPCFIKYDGPKDVEKLYANPAFVFTTGVRVQRNKVQRTRPRFNEWELDLVFQYEDSVFNKDAIKELVESAGRNVGFGDWRPKYGRFEIVE